MAGSTPQEVLFIVSDGVDDSKVGGARHQALFDTSYCTTVKNRGIRIAVLYTTYLPLPTNSGTRPTSRRSSRRSPAT